MEFNEENVPWTVYFANELDSWYLGRPAVLRGGLEKGAAKSIVRHLRKTTPSFMSYWAEEDADDQYNRWEVDSRRDDWDSDEDYGWQQL